MQEKKAYNGDVNDVFALLAGDCEMGNHADRLFDRPPGPDSVNLVNKASPSPIKIVQREREVFGFRSIGGVLDNLAVRVEGVDGY